MITLFNRSLHLVILLSLTVSLVQAQQHGEPSSKETLFVTITTGDAEAQMMALVLSTQAANQGVSIRILLCSEGGNLALSNHESPSFAPAGRSPQQLLGALIERGAVVEVCGIFLPNRPQTANDLLDGITAAAPPEVAAFMRRADVRLMTF